MLYLTLKELCLRRILSNFEMFTFAYSTSKDARLRKNLKFLQRKFSAELITQLSATKSMKDSYLDFLLNKYLKNLNFSEFNGLSSGAIIDRAIAIAKYLVKVTFNGKMLRKHRSRVKKFIGLLQDVKYMFLPLECDDEILQNVSRNCLNLTELHIAAVDVSEEAVNSLCACTCGSTGLRKLRILRLNSLELKKETAASILKSMPYLEIFENSSLGPALLSLHRNDLIKNKLNTIKKYSLTELDVFQMEDSDLVDVLTICSVLCPNIKTVTCCVNMKKHVDLLYNFPKLEKLHMKNEISDLFDLSNFLEVKGCNLISLVLVGRFLVCISVLAKHCQKLETLVLSDVYLLPLKNPYVLKDLKRLAVCGKNALEIEEALCLIMNSSPNLVSISVPESLKVTHFQSKVTRKTRKKKA